MIRKQLIRGSLLACAGFATLGLLAGPSSAAAKSKGKTKTKTATATVCTPVSVGVPTNKYSHVEVPFTLGTLPKGATIVDVNPQIRVSQQGVYMNTLIASPSGHLALLGNGDAQGTNAPDPDNDWGTGPACAGTPTTFDDTAPATFVGAKPPFAGAFQPLSPLANLNGGPAAGTWRFLLDDLGNDASAPATVNSVGATVVYRYKVKKKKKKSKKSAAISKKKKQKLGPPRPGSFDTCVNAQLPVNNGPNDPPTSDRATLGMVPVAAATIPENATITDVDARVRVTHTYEGDLEFYLASPTGVIVQLWNGNDQSGDDFGSGAPDCTGTFTVFDDEAPTPVLDCTSPLNGSFRPLFPLLALDGTGASGTWTLYVEDHYTGDRGVLHGVGLKIDYTYRPVKKSKKKS
jgi:subtilisin-like proprotein convertase family protein